MILLTATWRSKLETANDFFGQDFGVARPVQTEPAPEKPKPEKGFVQGALEFFGMDFTSQVGVPRNTAAPTAPNAKFEKVFSNLINQESQGVHATASGKMLTSSAGAEGITQVMPKTSGDPGFGVQPVKNKTEAEYLRFGRDYLKAMLKEFDGDYEKALAAYNAGVGNVKKAIEKGGENWKEKLPKKSETIPYINNILGKK